MAPVYHRIKRMKYIICNLFFFFKQRKKERKKFSVYLFVCMFLLYREYMKVVETHIHIDSTIQI